MPAIASAARRALRRPCAHREAAILVGTTMLLCAAAPGSAARRLPIAHAQPPATRTSCAIEDASSTLDHPAIPIGGTVRLALHWRWNYTTAAPPPRDILVIVDPTTASAGDAEAKVRMANLRDALARFAGTVGWESGGRFGTISAAGPPVTISPMAGGEAAHAAWRDALGVLASAPARDIVGAYKLAATALDGPPPAKGQMQPVVLVVDAGGALCQGATPPDPGLVDVCPLLAERGALVVTVSLSSTGARSSWCRTSGWFFRSGSTLGGDLSAILDEIAARITRDDGPPARVSTDVFVDTHLWEVVKAEPEADALFPDVSWQRDVNRQTSGEMSVAVTVRARAGVTPGEHAINVADGSGPRAVLLGYDGFERSRPLPNPTVCVYRPGRQSEDCGAVPTSAPLPSPVTSAPPSPTSAAHPTFTPSTTHMPSPRRVWLPAVLCEPAAAPGS